MTTRSARTTTKPAKTMAARPGSRAGKAAPGGASGSDQISARIAELGDWRGEALARVRALILDADREMIEETKWVKPTNPWGVPVWSHDGGICTGETYMEVVKLTFFKGASLPDPKHLFNSSLEGATRRAIDIRETDKINAPAFKALIRAAVALNQAGTKK